jgi:hypothetical protein
MSIVEVLRPSYIRVDLRFRRSQAPRLRDIAAQVRSVRPRGVDVSLYDKAAESADDGVPLTVLCSRSEEAEAMADAFARLGIRRPQVEYHDRKETTPPWLP